MSEATATQPEPLLPPPRTAGCLPLGRVAGIPVLLHWSWFLVGYLLIVYREEVYSNWAWKVAEYLALFGVVLLHELGHAFACRSVGGRVERILLWPLGGIAYVSPPPRPGPVLWSIAAGPLVNVVLVPVTFGLLLLASGAGWQARFHDAWHFLFMLALGNLGLLIFNLLPFYPLDGGRILHALLWFVLGQRRSLTVVSVLGLAGAAALLVVVATCLEWNWLLTAVCLFLAWQAVMGFVQARFLARPGWENLGPGLSYLHQGDYVRAVEEFTKALEQAGDNVGTRAMAFQRRGVAHLGRGDRQQAMADLTEAVKLAPHAVTFFTHGQANLLLGAHAEAIEDFSQALRLDPKHALAHHQRGDAHFRLGQHEQAQADLDRARQLNSQLPDHYPPEEDADEPRRKLGRAIAACNVALRMVPIAGGDLCNDALRLLQEGKPEEAIARCNGAIKRNPRIALAFALRAEARRLHGDYDAAPADLDAALRLDPNLALAHLCRGAVGRDTGNFDLALAGYDEAIRLDPTNPLAYLHRAALLRTRGEYARAVADYEEAIRRNPNDPIVYNDLAFVLATCVRDEVRDGARAVEYASHASRLTNGNQPAVLDTLAAACAEVGDFEAAREWQWAVVNHPELPEVWRERALQRLRLYEQGQPFRE